MGNESDLWVVGRADVQRLVFIIGPNKYLIRLVLCCEYLFIQR